MRDNQSSFAKFLINAAFVAFLVALGWVAVTQFPFISAQFEKLTGQFQGTGGGGGIGDKLGRMWKAPGNFAPFH